MEVTYEQMRRATAELYSAALKKVPDDTLDALRRVIGTETHEVARQTLRMMLGSAERAERESKLVCSDSEVPTYLIEIGTAVRMEGDLKRAVRNQRGHGATDVRPGPATGIALAQRWPGQVLREEFLA